MSDTLNDWWAKLGPDFSVSSKPQTGSTTRQEPKQQVDANDISSGNVDDRDFEVQVTPTHGSPRSPAGGKSAGDKAAHETSESNEPDVSDHDLAQSQNKLHPRIGTLGNLKVPPQDYSNSQSSQTLHSDDDDTASESEDEEKPTPPNQTKQSTTTTRLGTIGRSRQTPQPTKATTEMPAEAGDETASGSDSGDDSPPSPQISSTKIPVTPRKGALGRIGGKSRDITTSPPTPKDSTSGTNDDSAPPKRTEVRKIGAIGSKPHTESKRAHSDTPAEPEEPETDEQKAERKRSELAKEMNRKNTLPARKKRKF